MRSFFTLRFDPNNAVGLHPKRVKNLYVSSLFFYFIKICLTDLFVVGHKDDRQGSC